MNTENRFLGKYFRGLTTRGWIFREIGMMHVVLASTVWVFGQGNQLETDKGIAASIAPYEADVRQAILQASQYSDILSHLQKSQSQTAASFQKMIAGFSRKKQDWFYAL